jgi:hypothetical protein
MTQALYAHMNNKKNLKKKKPMELSLAQFTQLGLSVKFTFF